MQVSISEANQSFVTPLDYSVVDVRVVDNQPTVMIRIELNIVSMQLHLPVTLGLGFY